MMVPADEQLQDHDDSRPPVQQEYLEINTGRWRRVKGWFVYILLVLIIAALLVFIFTQVSGSWRIAVGVVIFMLAYMLVMARVTNKAMADHDKEQGQGR